MFHLPTWLRRDEGSRRDSASDLETGTRAASRAPGWYAVVGAAVILVVGAGAGGATYASGMITGADIKNGTVTTADVKNHTLRLKDFSAGATSALVGPKGDPGGQGQVGPKGDAGGPGQVGPKGDQGGQGQVGPTGDAGQVGPSDAYSTTKNADTSLTTSFATVVSLPLPAGDYVASVTGVVFAATSGATFADCTVTASGTTAFGESATTIPAGGSYASVAAQATFTTGADTTLTVKCLGSNAGINKITLTAIRVGSLHAS